MNIKKTIKYILIVVPLLFLAKWGIESAIYHSNKTPEINQNPTHKMRVYGDFPFENEVKLDMAVLYITTNPICDNNNWLAGIRFPQRFMKSFPATVKDGVFESDIYLDSYMPGMCEWQAYGVFSLLQSKKDVYHATASVHIDEEQTNDDTFVVNNNVYVGVIAHETFKEQGKTLDVECFKRDRVLWKDLPKEMILTKLYCKYIGEFSRSLPRRGYKPKANISSLQQDVEINFIDKDGENNGKSNSTRWSKNSGCGI